MSVEINVKPVYVPQITFDEAKKKVGEMNLINGFMFDSVLEDKEKGIIVVKGILDTVLDMDVPVSDVQSQKVITGLDSAYHGIRFDVCIDKNIDENSNAVVYDIEMEDREADKEELPRRGRYYQALTDSKKLPTGHSYLELPDYISITILSYDPFGADSMYYEVKPVITTHPQLEYDDGVRKIYLYCRGRNNLENDKEYGERLQEVLEYILTGKKRRDPSPVIDSMDKIVSDTKDRAEVTKNYMQRWDEIEHIKRDVKREVTEAVTKEVTENVTKEVTKEVTKKVTVQVTDEINALNQILISSGRLDDLSKSTTDTNFQRKLIEELVHKKDNIEDIETSSLK